MASELEQAEKLLLKFEDCLSKRDKYDDFALEIVKSLKKLGVSWAAIGDVYGVTHQGANQYWTKRMNRS